MISPEQDHQRTSTPLRAVLTIPLSGRRPVTINKEEWPVIAKASWDDATQPGNTPFRGEHLIVRQHADGKTIVYGKTWSQYPGEDTKKGGFLLDSGEWQRIYFAIREVGEELGLHASTVEWCFEDLPSENV